MELLSAKTVITMRKSHLSSTELTVARQVFNAKLVENSPRLQVEALAKLTSMKKVLYVDAEVA